MGYTIDLSGAPLAQELLQAVAEKIYGKVLHDTIAPIVGRPDKSRQLTTFSAPDGFSDKEEATRKCAVILRALNSVSLSKNPGALARGSSVQVGIAQVNWEKTLLLEAKAEFLAALERNGITQENLAAAKDTSQRPARAARHIRHSGPWVRS